eukprot:TRINITY_DN18019_c0_g1_i2.p1 TRINITY_DN18019_c0_g1~~TRINITY_DN18019_c0_g1_i2.p1  ORF type:complete len:499 (-),score=79.40 TRINITY_DN18019_c0_g1_i2:435-1931(-)
MDPPIEAVVFGWGVNEDGQLAMDTPDDVTSPKVVEALLGMQFRGREFGKNPLVTGSRNTLAIDAIGQVWAWGWNDRGTLGLGHRQPENKPKQVSALKDVQIAQVAIGGWHCLALSEKGEVFAWGGNEYFQCGLEVDKRDIVTPTLFRCFPEIKVRQIACGGMHSLALSMSGDVYQWGEPWGDFSLEVSRNIRKVAKLENIALVAAGAFHNLALDWEGEVFAWGINEYGQLGNGGTNHQTVPESVVGLEEIQVADIDCGGWHSLALSTEGEVFTWGRGEYGRLGLGDRKGSSKLRPQKVMGLEKHRVVQARCGGSHTVCLTEEGRLFIFGRGSFGRLGQNDTKNHTSPIEVELPGGHERWRIVSISAGGRHTLCLAVPTNSTTLQGTYTASTPELVTPLGASPEDMSPAGGSDADVGEQENADNEDINASQQQQQQDQQMGEQVLRQQDSLDAQQTLWNVEEQQEEDDDPYWNTQYKRFQVSEERESLDINTPQQGRKQ